MTIRHWAAAFAATFAFAGAAHAQQFFRIGTGGTAGTYYPVGGMIANAISQPGKIVATAQATNGSVANINGDHRRLARVGLHAVRRRVLGLHRHRHYEGKPKVAGLRLIANLYPETIHLVARKGAGIKTRRRSEGQARVARRAGLGHAGRRQARPRRVRHHRKTSSPST